MWSWIAGWLSWLWSFISNGNGSGLLGWAKWLIVWPFSSQTLKTLGLLILGAGMLWAGQREEIGLIWNILNPPADRTRVVKPAQIASPPAYTPVAVQSVMPAREVKVNAVGCPEIEQLAGRFTAIELIAAGVQKDLAAIRRQTKPPEASAAPRAKGFLFGG